MNAKTIDQGLTTEFQLCIENEGALYGQRQAIERLLLRRMRAGTYDTARKHGCDWYVQAVS